MHEWSPEQVAAAAGGRLVAPAPHAAGPSRAVIDSRAAGPGDLFVGLVGEHVDGGRFAAQALAGGAWGVLVAPAHADAARCAMPGAVIAAQDPLHALQRLANAWRRALGCRVVGITGSVGKTSTKDILAAMLAEKLRTVANRENLNTEIGLPMTVLEAPAATEVLVLEMGMRGPGQIAELSAIAEPEVGLITAVAPVHLELMGSIEAIAAAKAELVAGLRTGGTAIVPAGEPLLDAHRRDDITTVTFGPGGDVARLPDGLQLVVTGVGGRERMSAHMRRNALAALAAARAVGVEPDGLLEVALSGLRGQRIELPGGIVVVNDCYNANPMSMRAALDDLAASEVRPPARRVAVLGDMLELGPDEARFHAEIGAHARAAGVDVLVAVGPRAAHLADGYGEVIAVPDAQAAAAIVEGLLEPGDVVLLKGSRGVGLEVVARALEGD
ncbi:MAG TPA: UDP-N-acetylmuramoyl-tripeptide--D-alanyl-D-alanine ligase [Solirubrobacteraceae bacterium]|nr:UDP-N-acetylmuramoyl-tripeptide--D-alanyl-D-alanine ligase [Solirubrobacteraceae bacterium]